MVSNDNETLKSVVTTYRLSQDAKGKLQQQLKDLGLTQEQYFNKVVSLMELWVFLPNTPKRYVRQMEYS
jgi:hypothetical protein